MRRSNIERIHQRKAKKLFQNSKIDICPAERENPANCDFQKQRISSQQNWKRTRISRKKKLNSKFPEQIDLRRMCGVQGVRRSRSGATYFSRKIFFFLWIFDLCDYLGVSRRFMVFAFSKLRSSNWHWTEVYRELFSLTKKAIRPYPLRICDCVRPIRQRSKPSE